MAAPKLARAALSKLSHGRSRLSRRVSPAAPSLMLLLRADELAHGLRPSPLPPGSTESRLALDELAHGHRRQTRRARKRSDSLRPWPRPSAREEEDAEPLARAILLAGYGHLAGVNTGRHAGSPLRRVAGGRSSGVSVVEHWSFRAACAASGSCGQGPNMVAHPRS